MDKTCHQIIKDAYNMLGKLYKPMLGLPYRDKEIYCIENNIDITDYVFAETYYIQEHIKKLKASVSKYAYFITFTLKPNADEQSAYNLILDIRDKRAQALHITKMDIVREHTRSGVAHWHTYIEANKPIKKDRFNYYIQHYGNIDIKKANPKDYLEIQNYMSKEGIINKD